MSEVRDRARFRSEMRKRIISAIAECSPYSEKELDRVYEMCGSFDVLLGACQFAMAYNVELERGLHFMQESDRDAVSRMLF